MRRKNIKTRHVVFGIMLLMVVVLGIFSLTLNSDRKLNKFEALVKDTTTSVARVVTYPFNYIFLKIDGVKELINIRKKYLW